MDDMYDKMNRAESSKKQKREKQKKQNNYERIKLFYLLIGIASFF